MNKGRDIIENVEEVYKSLQKGETFSSEIKDKIQKELEKMVQQRNEHVKMKFFEKWKGQEFDGRKFTDETIPWQEIRIGDVVLEGFTEELTKDSYKTLTDVQGKHWEYLSNGHYHATSPEFCHWLVVGQSDCDGKLVYIEYENE